MRSFHALAIRRLRRRRRRAGAIAIDKIVRSDGALLPFRFLEFGKRVAAAAAGDIERLGKPNLARIEIELGAAAERGGHRQRRHHGGTI